MFCLQKDCFNYIKLLLRLNDTHLYVCGTYAFSPTCTYIVSEPQCHFLSLCHTHTHCGRFLTNQGGRNTVPHRSLKYCPTDPQISAVDSKSTQQGNEP